VVLGEARGFKSNNDDAGTLDIHYRPDGLEDQATFICDSIIPDALGRREGRKLGDIAILYRNQFDGNVIAKAVEDRGWQFIRIDQGNPYPRSPMVYWLQDCAAWCGGGWESGNPRLSELVRTWLRFNETVTSDAGQHQLRRRLVKFLHTNRKSDLPLRDWLSAFRAACIEYALTHEPGLRDDKAAVEILAQVCAAGSRLAGFTVSGFGGQGGSWNHLNLLTLHSAKGLEYDVVVIMALEEGKLPDFRATTEGRLREERRLFYVGLTRARHEVHLVYSGWYRTNFGTVISNGVSRFVKNVKASLTSPME